MKRIGIISDTHSYFYPKIKEHFAEVDLIWHAGDIGDMEVFYQLDDIAPTRAVWGNIDHSLARRMLNENEIFMCEDVKVMIRHIAGYPGRYNLTTKELIEAEKPDLVVVGHSHILKVIYDKELKHLHINPGAAGKVGLHKICTLIRLTIDGKDMKDLEVIEFSRGN